MKLDGKVALVTGAGAGIGRSIALLFAREGASVVVADANRAAYASGEETVKLIKNAGGKAVFVLADVSKAADVRTMVEKTVDVFGRIDVLVNNAGIFIAKRLVDVSEDEWDTLMDINLKGVFLCSKYAVPQMAASGGGVIVNMSSMAALAGYDLATAYCASKAGVLLLTKAMAVELMPERIRVNALCPGVVNDEMGKQVAAGYKTHGMPIPDIRLAPGPEAVARAALYLASDDSSPTTGHGLVVGAAGVG